MRDIITGLLLLVILAMLYYWMITMPYPVREYYMNYNDQYNLRR
jgi:hypothetical protein